MNGNTAFLFSSSVLQPPRFVTFSKPETPETATAESQSVNNIRNFIDGLPNNEKMCEQDEEKLVLMCYQCSGDGKNQEKELLDLALEYHLSGNSVAKLIARGATRECELPIGVWHPESEYYSNVYSRFRAAALFTEKIFVKSLIKGADGGRKVAQFEVGKRYLEGDKLEKDHDLAVKYLQQSADQGYEPAIALFETALEAAKNAPKPVPVPIKAPADAQVAESSVADVASEVVNSFFSWFPSSTTAAVSISKNARGYQDEL